MSTNILVSEGEPIQGLYYFDRLLCLPERDVFAVVKYETTLVRSIISSNKVHKELCGRRMSVIYACLLLLKQRRGQLPRKDGRPQIIIIERLY